MAEEFVTLAEAAGWRTQWEDPEPYDIPVVRRQEYFVRGEWTLHMIALSGAYSGGLEVGVSLTNAV